MAVAFARALLPALGRVFGQTGIPETVLLAMAAWSARWGTDPGSAWARQHNPWALTQAPPPRAHARGVASDAGPRSTPSLEAAAADAAQALGPWGGTAAAHAWSLRGDPPTFLRALAEAGWPAATGRDGWAMSVAALLPVAGAALAVAQAGVPEETAFGPVPGPLSMAEAAHLALRHVKPSAAAVMVAVGAACSGLDPLAAGCPCAQYADADLVRELSACAHPRARPLPDAGAAPHAAFGWMQIDMATYSRALAREAHSTDPVVWAWWLSVPTNSAALAAAIAGGRQGWGAWPAYAGGAYRAHLAAAQAAVAAVGGAL